MPTNARTNRLTLRQTVPPSSEPVPLADAKLHCRVTITDDDALITSLITVARTHCEDRMRRQLMPATWRLSLDVFPYLFESTAAFVRQTREGTDILLPRPPLVSVSAITYFDPSGTLQTLSPSTYIVSPDDEPGRLSLVLSQVWPIVQQDTMNAVQIVYTAGYATAAAIPAPIILAIKMLIGHWYENREAVTIGAIPKQMEYAVDSLLRPYTVQEIW